MAKISDVFDLQMGKTPARAKEKYWIDGANKWVSIGDLSGYEKYVEDTKERITDLAVAESGIKVVPSDTVIMSFKLSLGKVAITKTPVYTNEAIMAFLPKHGKSILSDYFYHYFNSKKKAYQIDTLFFIYFSVTVLFSSISLFSKSLLNFFVHIYVDNTYTTNIAGIVTSPIPILVIAIIPSKTA